MLLCVAKGSQHGASAVKMELWAPEGGVRGSLLNRTIDQEFNCELKQFKAAILPPEDTNRAGDARELTHGN